MSSFFTIQSETRTEMQRKQPRKVTTKRLSDDGFDTKTILMKQKKLITVSDIPICTQMVRTGFISL